MKQRIGVLILILLSHSSFAAEMWYSEYDMGLKAIAARDWNSAEKRLKTALSLQPKQGRKVLAYGVRFIRYIPDYYLGVVYFNQGKHQDALNYFQRMQKAGLVVQGDPEFGELTRMTQLADEKLKPKTEEPKPPPAVTSAPVSEEPKPKENLEQAAQAQQLEEEKRKREQLDDLIKKADLALSAKDFKQSREFAKQVAATGIDEAQSDQLLKRIEIAERVDSLTKAVNKKEWEAAQSIAQQLRSLDPKNPELSASQTLIDQGLSELKTQDLSDRGLLAFLSGDYQQAVKVLEQVIVMKKDSAEPWFYLGCSHAALGLLQGKQGQELLKKAQQEFVQARRFNAKLNSATGLISPRILELYQQTR